MEQRSEWPVRQASEKEPALDQSAQGCNWLKVIQDVCSKLRVPANGEGGKIIVDFSYLKKKKEEEEEEQEKRKEQEKEIRGGALTISLSDAPVCGACRRVMYGWFCC